MHDQNNGQEDVTGVVAQDNADQQHRNNAQAEEHSVYAITLNFTGEYLGHKGISVGLQEVFAHAPQVCAEEAEDERVCKVANKGSKCRYFHQ